MVNLDNEEINLEPCLISFKISLCLHTQGEELSAKKTFKKKKKTISISVRSSKKPLVEFDSSDESKPEATLPMFNLTLNSMFHKKCASRP